MIKLIKKMLINKISDLHDYMLEILYSKQEEVAISEFESVCGDIAEYFDNEVFEEFTIIDLLMFIHYIKELIKAEEQEIIANEL